MPFFFCNVLPILIMEVFIHVCFEGAIKILGACKDKKYQTQN